MRVSPATGALLAAAAFAASAAFASPARAEEIVLVSGTTYDARDLTLLDKVLNKAGEKEVVAR